MSIANDIMKEPAKSLETSMTQADFAEKRASEIAVKQELSDEESTYFFEDGSLLIVHADGSMRSGIYGQPPSVAVSQSLLEPQVGQLWERRDGESVRVNIKYPNGNTVSSDELLRRSDGKHYAYRDFDLICKVSIPPLSPPPLILPDFNAKIEQSDAEGVYFTNDGKERDWTHAEQLDQFRKLHMALSTCKEPPVPYPSIIRTGANLEVWGINGFLLGTYPHNQLEDLKAALGFPVYTVRQIQSDEVRVTNYEVQP